MRNFIALALTFALAAPAMSQSAGQKLRVIDTAPNDVRNIRESRAFKAQGGWRPSNRPRRLRLRVGCPSDGGADVLSFAGVT